MSGMIFILNCLSHCFPFFLQNFLKDHMVQIVAFTSLTIPQAGLRIFMYEFSSIRTCFSLFILFLFNILFSGNFFFILGCKIIWYFFSLLEKSRILFLMNLFWHIYLDGGARLFLFVISHFFGYYPLDLSWWRSVSQPVPAVCVCVSIILY